MQLPENISTIYICIPGDPSVGLFTRYFRAETDIDLSQDIPKPYLEEIRKMFEILYTTMFDEGVKVTFDFEEDILLETLDKS